MASLIDIYPSEKEILNPKFLGKYIILDDKNKWIVSRNSDDIIAREKSEF